MSLQQRKLFDDTCDSFQLLAWTRFPILNNEGKFGGYLHAPANGPKFEVWFNPTAHKSEREVNEQIHAFMVKETVDGKEKLLPNYDIARKRQSKFEKFWLAVHVLYECVANACVVDDNTLNKCKDVFQNTIKNKYLDVPKTKYTSAGLFLPESDDLKKLYREFRTDLNLSDVDKDNLMKFLLCEKRNVMELFSKVDVISNAVAVVAMNSGPKIEIRFAQDQKPDDKRDEQRDEDDALQGLLQLRPALHRCTGPGNGGVHCKVDMLLVKLRELQF
jgi:hypothetical protein